MSDATADDGGGASGASGGASTKPGKSSKKTKGGKAAAAPCASLFVVTQRGEFYAYGLDGATGACTLQDERRFLDA